MSKVLVNETSLTSIANAIREKNGTTESYKPSQMGAAIAAIETGGGGIPEECLVLTGNCKHRFANDGWNWFIEEYSDKITTENITNVNSMFHSSKMIEEIPFTINAENATDWQYTFMGMYNVKYIAPIPVINASMAGNMFSNCWNLRYLPEVETITINRNATSGIAEIIYGCYSLREIPDKYIDAITGNTGCTSAYSHPYKNFLYACYALDEVKNIRVNTEKELTSNMLSGAFGYCWRLKNITFALATSGEVYKAKWKNQTIQINNGVGWMNSTDKDIIGYNSGITIDKKVVDGETYQALKNDPDWYTGDVYYSRFNKISALNMINSLPDTSEYLATQSGGTNTIKFRSDAGSLTDGGGIGNLTEEEIAVATAKGWSVVYAV